MVPGSPHTYSEIYFVLLGTAHYLCQKVCHDDGGKPQVLDAFCIVTNAGDVVFIPPDYDHFTVNASDGTLIVGNWAGTGILQHPHGPKAGVEALRAAVEKAVNEK